MATLCTHCGTALKDDARFCNSCGTLVPSHPFSPASAASSAARDEENEVTPAAGPGQHGTSPRQLHASPKDGPPSWMIQLEAAARNRSKTPAGALADHLQEKPSAEADALRQTPEDIQAKSLAELPTAELPSSKVSSQAQRQTTPRGPVQEVFPPASSAGPLPSSVRELHVKVWDQKEPAAAVDDFEDRPTRPLIASSPEVIARRDATSSPESKAQDARVEELERLDTVRLGAQPVRERVSFAPVEPIHELRAAPPPQSSVTHFKRRNSRKPLLFGLLAFVLLVTVVGASAWIVIYEPFSVPAITQPLRTFSDQQLGLSLLYPSSWQAQKDRASAAVHFVDSSHTVQVSVVVNPARGGNSSQYVQRQAAQLGLTAQKAGTTLAFAGTSWQQVRGNVQQSGANYSETLLVAARHSRFYTLLFLAPQAIFVREDQVVFSEIRSSLQFLA